MVCKVSDCGSGEIHCKQLCKKHYMQWFRQKPEQIDKRSEYNRKHYLDNKKWYAERNKRSVVNPAHRQMRAKWRKQSLEDSRRRSRELYWKNPGKGRARAIINNCKRALRIPGWLTDSERRQIIDFYKNCPKGYHVDHVLPLQGKNVSGLHVLSNLQYLFATDNIRKGNKV